MENSATAGNTPRSSPNTGPRFVPCSKFERCHNGMDKGAGSERVKKRDGRGEGDWVSEACKYGAQCIPIHDEHSSAPGHVYVELSNRMGTLPI